MSNDFNYDNDDQQLDENGLPIYTDDEDDEGSSSSDLMDTIRQARESDEDDNDDSSSRNNDKKKRDSSSETSHADNKTVDNKPNPDSKPKETGGRYGDTPPSQKPQDTSKLTKSTKSPQNKPTSTKTGGDNWFSKLTSKFKRGKGGALKEAGKKAGKEAGKAAAKGASKAGGKAATQGGSTIIKAISSGGPYVWLAILIIIIVVILICIIVAVVAFLKEKSDPENMSNNPYVISSYYYGIRTVYIDDGVLLNSLDLSYKQYVINVLEDINADNPELNIDIELPENLTIDTLVNKHINNMSIAIANVAATESDLTNYSGIELSTLYPSIAYFGLTDTERVVVTDFILQYLETNLLLKDKDGNPYTNSIDKSKINNDENLKYILNRCEKVMIKDEIATSSGLSGIEERQYIASIYMPCENIQIDGSIYTIASTSEELNVVSKQIEENDGKQTIHKEKETNNNSDIIIGFELGDVFVNKFTSIDEENIDAFAEGVSLFDAINKSTNYTSYFTKDETTGLYTWKPTDTSLLYYTYDASAAFIFCDFQLNTQLP